MKIPTLLGLTLIITLIALSGLYYFYSPKPQQSGNLQPSNLTVVNITGTSATIVWQTASPTIGSVIYSQFEPLSQTASDSRDRGLPVPRLVHFVTINNLRPNSRYVYKVKNNDSVSPEKALEFKTANFVEQGDESLTFSFIKPLKGTILNTNLNPVDESLIFLKIPGAQELAAFSSTAGNFILPLKTVLNNDLNKIFIIAPDTPADLTIIKGALKSEVKIRISETNINLPPIPIGSNLDLTNFKPQPITKITLSNTPSSGLDFNNDGRINSLDLALLREAAKPGTLIGTDTRSKFDVNGDRAVDQNDINEFSRILSGN